MFKPTRRRLTLAALALSTFVVLPAAGQTINEDIKLTAIDGAAGDQLGFSIAIDDGIIAVGAWRADDNGSDSGSAYLFDAATGVQLFKLLPSDGAAGDQFGISIAIDNGIVAVGAYHDDDNGPDSGSAFLFDASTGAQIAKLLPNDSAESDKFGVSIAIDNGVVAVGAWLDDENGNDSGSAYLFDTFTGAQIFKILPSDGAADDYFGRSIAMDNGIIAVGATSDNDNGNNSGSAYLFNASTGTQLFKILPSDGAANDSFGISIAIDNGFVAVGAWADDDNGNASGSAYIFDAATGTQLFKILPSDGAANDMFGIAIAIENGIMAVGADGDDDKGNASGSAYLFDTTTGTQIAKLLPSDGSAGDQFGISIAVDNGIYSVGASLDDDNGTWSGSAYVLDTGISTTCLADFTNDGILNFFDVSAFIIALTNNDPIADFNNDGRWNFFDISEFLQAFTAGCP